MHQSANIVVETMKKRNIDICCIQETRCCKGFARTISGNRSKYKLFWNGGETGFEGVGVLIKEKLMDHVVSVERVYKQII